jgi:retron-type reverse transcriptase
MANTGLPKEGNLHGNRATVVFERKRVAVNGASNSRSYSTGRTTSEKLNVIGKLEDLYLRSERFTNESVDRNLYKILTNVELLELAYNKLRSKPGQMTPGVKPETLDGISKEVLEDIVAKLKNESFQFSPGRRVQIPKPSGGTRPLTIAPPRDKLVQEAMRMILEAVFEPTFSKYSHGFRPGKGCHSALKAVRQDFQPTNWIIEGDISKCFDSIDHAKLMNIIEAKILDRKFTRLI